MSEMSEMTEMTEMTEMSEMSEMSIVLYCTVRYCTVLVPAGIITMSADQRYKNPGNGPKAALMYA